MREGSSGARALAPHIASAGYAWSQCATPEAARKGPHTYRNGIYLARRPVTCAHGGKVRAISKLWGRFGPDRFDGQYQLLVPAPHGVLATSSGAGKIWTHSPAWPKDILLRPKENGALSAGGTTAAAITPASALAA
jgi:hypothetical protein